VLSRRSSALFPALAKGVACLALAAALGLGCAGRLSGVVDFDEDVAFDALRTLAFY